MDCSPCVFILRGFFCGEDEYYYYYYYESWSNKEFYSVVDMAITSYYELYNSEGFDGNVDFRAGTLTRLLHRPFRFCMYVVCTLHIICCVHSILLCSYRAVLV